MKSKSFQAVDTNQIDEVLQNIIRTDFKPTLAVVFGSPECDLNNIPEVFGKYNIEVVGASSAGELCDEEVSESSITVMLMDPDPNYFHIDVQEAMGQQDTQVGINAGEKTGQCANEHFENSAFLIFFPMTINGEAVITGLQNVVSGKPSIFGGIAADDLRMKQTYAISSSGVHTNSLVTLIFNNDKIEMTGTAICGWEPIGAVNEITSSTHNVVHTINNKPALEVFESYFGDYYMNTEQEDTLAVGVAQYPMQLIREDSVVLRAALDVNEEDGSIIMTGPVKTGDVFRFSVAPGFEIIEETLKNFKEYNKTNSEADALILISCKARHMSLGPVVEEEVAGIQNIWNKPLVGFFSYGEVGLSQVGDCYLYNETCSLVLLKEK